MNKTQSQYSLGLFCPLYKGKTFIKEYLDNALSQTIFNKTKFYILDCNSPDGEYEIIKEYLKYENIVYRKMNEDPGLYASWNVCVDWVEEEYIGNWNVDDRKTPWSNEILLNEIIRSKSDLVYGRTLVTSKPNDSWDTTDGKIYFACLDHSLENLLKNNSPHCMPVWRKDLHDRFGYFNEEYMTAADTDMWLRACKGGAKIKKVDEYIGLYYKNPNGRSTNPETLKQMIAEVKEVRSKYKTTLAL